MPDSGQPVEHVCRHAGAQLRYQLKRSARRRSIGLKIDSNGLTVALPARLPLAEAERVIRLKWQWIHEKLHDVPEPVPPIMPGQPVLLLGQSLELVPASRSRVADGKLHLPITKDASTALIRFYQREARQLFASRLQFWSEHMQLFPRRWLLSSARSRWGSCTAAGDVRLSWRLMQAPLCVIDYVIVHELAHLAELNHSERFWAIVARYLPDWQSERKWLRQHGAALQAV